MHQTSLDGLTTARRAAVVLLLVWIALFAMRITGPVDLVTRDQSLSLAYFVDTAENGSWICARDHFGDPASKPPLHNWLGAISIITLGRSFVAAALPSALAVLATALWLLIWGGRRMNLHIGWVAALIFLLSPLTIALIVVVRADAVFTLLVVLATGFAFDAWRGHRSWWPFWISATLASLTKGPLGLVLPAAGLLAAWWMGREGEPLATHRRWWPGAIFYLAVLGGWFALGWRMLGPAFVDELFWQELIGHAVRNDHGRSLITTFWQPTAYLLARFAPWSVLLVPAMWRIVRRPAKGIEERALERFLITAIAVGLVVFSLAGHKRGDLVAPLTPMAALLAAREIERWTRHWSAARKWVTATLIAAVLVTSYSVYHHVIRARNTWVDYSAAHHAFAVELADHVDDAGQLEYTSGWFLVQYHLGTFRGPIRPRDALRQLSGGDPAWIVASPVEDLTGPAARRGVGIHVLLRGQRDIALISNVEHYP